ncbi:hypothetical protein ANCCAN_21819 [Ancylostoma caninum]|uniref:Uncharacterized protein n=1 Tax=Ancylostoma caninum TaxID=29170 RepID=A0A368FJE6_ANCCA|nr:hypothetical protein ANCCAN_21819 [Ancylostoma caninum]
MLGRRRIPQPCRIRRSIAMPCAMRGSSTTVAGAVHSPITSMFVSKQQHFSHVHTIPNFPMHRPIYPQPGGW